MPGVRVLVAGLLLAVPGSSLAGCSGSAPPDDPDAAPTAAAPAPPDVVRRLTRALDRRAEAVRRADAAAFEAGLARGRPDFLREQRVWFAGVTQLPLGRLDYVVDRASLTRVAGGEYWVVVERRLQLEGYDAVPVTTPDRFRFTPAPGRPGRFLLASTTDRDWEAAHPVDLPPWDTGRIEVRTGAGVLGIFDAGSVPAADGVVAAVERGLADVAAVVPYPWSRSVVVYALSDTEFLTGLEDLPGGDPERVDGVAFPVPATPAGGRVAATRIVFHPRLLDRPGPQRDRLIRHELTHVALGERDDVVPLWLSEGLAEYVSVRPLAPEDRMIAPAAVERAAEGLDALPPDGTFNDEDSSVHYAVAWWACEYLADSLGEPVLWTLLDAMGEPGADPGRVLQERTGVGPDELVGRAARLILARYPVSGSAPGSPPGAPAS